MPGRETYILILLLVKNFRTTELLRRFKEKLVKKDLSEGNPLLSLQTDPSGLCINMNGMFGYSCGILKKFLGKKRKKILLQFVSSLFSACEALFRNSFRDKILRE